MSNFNNNQYQPQQQYSGEQQQKPRLPGATSPKFKTFQNNDGSTTFSISMSFNAQSQSERVMNFGAFIAALQQAFQQSGGQGVFLAFNVRPGVQGPRGPFDSLGIKISPKQTGGRNYQNGGGRTQYPSANPQQGYPQQTGYGQQAPQGYPQQAPQQYQPQYAPPPQQYQPPVAQPTQSMQAAPAPSQSAGRPTQNSVAPVGSTTTTQVNALPKGPPVPSDYKDENIPF
jgi:hypothetical protein